MRTPIEILHIIVAPRQVVLTIHLVNLEYIYLRVISVIHLKENSLWRLFVYLENILSISKTLIKLGRTHQRIIFKLMNNDFTV